MSSKNIHAMDYIAALIELLVREGWEPEFEFLFHGKTYFIVAYQDGVTFGECSFERSPEKPVHTFGSIWAMFRCEAVEGIRFHHDWPHFEEFDCLDFSIPTEGSEEQKILFRELNNHGGIPV